MSSFINGNDLRVQLKAVLRRVQAGERIIICRYRTPIAAIVPIEAVSAAWTEGAERVEAPIDAVGVADGAANPVPGKILPVFTMRELLAMRTIHDSAVGRARKGQRKKR